MREILLLYLSPHLCIYAYPLPLPQMQWGLGPTACQTKPPEGRLEEPDSQPTKYFQALWHAHRARRRAFLSLTHVPYAFTSYASGPTDAI